MALDAICGMSQRRAFSGVGGNHGGLRNGLPAVEDFDKEFEALQLGDNGVADPMHIPRPPFVS